MGRRLAIALTLAAFAGVGACFTSLDGFANGDADAGHDGDVSHDGPGGDDGPVDGGTEADASDAEAGGCDELGLVARWPMDEGSGTTVHDCSTNHLDMAFAGEAGALAWGTRDGGGTLVINGHGYAEIANTDALTLPASFTIAAFMRAESRPSSYAGFPWHFAGKGWELTMASDGTVYAQVGPTGFDGSVVEGFTSPQLGTWHHFAAVFEPGVRLETYEDGVSVVKKTGIPPGGADKPDAPIRIGAVFDGVTWLASIDDVRLYSRALSDTEIATLAKK
jgi:hypothetical protein